jgi:hypothetical protein
MKLASSPRLPPGDGSLRSKNQMTNRRCTSGSPFWISAFQKFRFQHFPCGFTEPTLALGRGQARAPNPLPTRQLSTRFRPRMTTDSPICTRSTPFHFNFGGRQCGSHLHFHSIAFRRPQTVETVRTQIVRARNAKWPRDFVRPVSNSPRCFARARHRNRPRDSVRPQQAIVREAPPGQEMAITVSTAIFRPLHSAGAPFCRSENGRPH